MSEIPHVVIIGGGFAGLTCARRLKKAPVRITLFDARNHHLFQPLLYQVATAALSAPDIAAPIRKLLAGQANTTVLARGVSAISLADRSVTFDGGVVHYDYLVVAAGAVNHYYGNPQWEAWAPGLKTIDDAFEIRRRVLGVFEEAELTADPEVRRELLTFAVVGGGATGVELAGALSEIASRTMRKQFRHFDPEDARVVLVEGGPRLLNGFPEVLCEKARARLEALGVEVRLNARVADIDAQGVHLQPPPSAANAAAAPSQPAGSALRPGELIAARTVLWGAGVAGAPIGKQLGLGVTRGGKVRTDPCLHPVPADGGPSAHPEVFVCGDLAEIDPSCNDGKPTPGVAPAALQMGRYAADQIRESLSQPNNRESLSQVALPPATPFRYFDKGQLATIGRMSAVAALGKRRFAGAFAWLLWVVVHILYLASFRNRVVVLFEWAWAWFTWSRPGRIILERPSRWPPEPRPIEEGPPPQVEGQPAGTRITASPETTTSPR
jgi:NADH dehydrogenase